MVKFGFEKYLKGINYPSYAKYASFMCLNCGFQPLSFTDSECEFCKMDMRESDEELSLFNQRNSIAIGCLILNVFDTKLKEIMHSNDDTARQIIVLNIKSWVNEYSSEYYKISKLLHKWLIPGSELCYDGRDLYQHYKKQYEFLCSIRRADFITKVSVKGLFGQLSYSIIMKNDFSVIVGPNAIGKTTIFNLMECLLTNPQDPGAKLTNAIRLLDTPYDMFTINFAGGASVIATHQTDGLHISYNNMLNQRGFSETNRELSETLFLKIERSDDSALNKLIDEHFEKLSRLLVNVNINHNVFYFTKVNRINDFAAFSQNLRNQYVHFRINNWNQIEQLIKKYETPAFVNYFSNALSKSWNTIYTIVYENQTKKSPLFVEEQTVNMFDEVVSKGLYHADRGETLKLVRNYIEGCVAYDPKKCRINKDSKALYDSICELHFLSTNFDYFKEQFRNLYYDDDLTIKTPIIGENGQIQFKSLATGVILSPGQLSSGEINLAAVIFDLIFRMQEGSVLLIDEPEISLHLIWQQHFANMVLDILRFKNMEAQVIIASHSPFIASGNVEFITGVEHEQ